MSSPLPIPAPHATLDEDAWEDLLNFIEERRVIPIIGPELLQVETESGQRLLYDWVAEKLAARLNVDTTALPQPYTLNDVVCWFLASRGRREEAYTRVRSKGSSLSELPSGSATSTARLFSDRFGLMVRSPSPNAALNCSFTSSIVFASRSGNSSATLRRPAIEGEVMRRLPASPVRQNEPGYQEPEADDRTDAVYRSS